MTLTWVLTGAPAKFISKIVSRYRGPGREFMCIFRFLKAAHSLDVAPLLFQNSSTASQWLCSLSHLPLWPQLGEVSLLKNCMITMCFWVEFDWATPGSLLLRDTNLTTSLSPRVKLNILSSGMSVWTILGVGGDAITSTWMKSIVYRSV